MAKRQQVEKWLLILVFVGTIFAQSCSMSHMIVAYSFANTVPMAWALAIATVVMSGVFLGLSVITPESRARRACLWGMGLLVVIETAWNTGVGGMLVGEAMPAGIAVFFGLDSGLAQRLAAFTLSGFLPILAFIAIYALAEKGVELMKDPPVDLRAEQLLRMYGDSPEPREPGGAEANGAGTRRGG